jgi:hypothetical protein
MRSLPICAMTQGYEERQMSIANDVVPAFNILRRTIVKAVVLNA